MRHLASPVALFASMLLAGCSFQSKTSLLNPMAPSSVAAATSAGTSSTPAPSSSTSSASAASCSPSPDASPFAGTWASPTIGGLPNISSCTNLQWQISNLSATSVAGSVSAACGGSVTITANLTGELNGSDVVNLTANGQAVALGITCGFNLTGVGHRETNDAMRLEYQGMTCLGPISGTEMLRRNSPAPPPAASTPEPPPAPEPERAPDDEIFGCTQFLPERVRYIECIHSHVRPTNEHSAFEVTKRVAWGMGTTVPDCSRSPPAKTL